MGGRAVPRTQARRLEKVHEQGQQAPQRPVSCEWGRGTALSGEGKLLSTDGGAWKQALEKRPGLKREAGTAMPSRKMPQ